MLEVIQYCSLIVCWQIDRFESSDIWGWGGIKLTHLRLDSFKHWTFTNLWELVMVLNNSWAIFTGSPAANMRFYQFDEGGERGVEPLSGAGCCTSNIWPGVFKRPFNSPHEMINFNLLNMSKPNFIEQRQSVWKSSPATCWAFGGFPTDVRNTSSKQEVSFHSGMRVSVTTSVMSRYARKYQLSWL